LGVGNFCGFWGVGMGGKWLVWLGLGFFWG
jgi:hypothetical protein